MINFISLHALMTVRRKYKQLKLSMDVCKKQYDEVPLSFMLNSQRVSGVLKGSSNSWVFLSASTPFLKQVPGGKLFKYAFWSEGVPPAISNIYNGIWDAALKAGYDLAEEE